MFLVVYGRFDASFFSHTEKKDVGIEKRKSGRKKKKKEPLSFIYYCRPCYNYACIEVHSCLAPL
jgi:hypothetical protein